MILTSSVTSPRTDSSRVSLQTTVSKTRTTFGPSSIVSSQTRETISILKGNTLVSSTLLKIGALRTCTIHYTVMSIIVLSKKLSNRSRELYPQIKVCSRQFILASVRVVFCWQANRQSQPFMHSKSFYTLSKQPKIMETWTKSVLDPWWVVSTTLEKAVAKSTADSTIKFKSTLTSKSRLTSKFKLNSSKHTAHPPSVTKKQSVTFSISPNWTISSELKKKSMHKNQYESNRFSSKFQFEKLRYSKNYNTYLNIFWII